MKYNHTQLERVWKFSWDLMENIHCFYEKIWFISKSLGKISGFKRIPVKWRLTLTRPCYKYHTKRPNKPTTERPVWRSASLLACNNRKKHVISVELVHLNKLLEMLLFRSDSSCLLWFLFMHDQLMQLRVCCSAPVAHIDFKLRHLAYTSHFVLLCINSSSFCSHQVLIIAQDAT